jgi:site-specific DNA-cytosine methylase
VPVILIELWAGVGVLSLAFKQHNIPLAAFLEREALLSAFLSHPDSHPAALSAGLFEDRKWESWILPKEAILVVAGGPSCTSIAAPGKRLAGQDPSSRHLAHTLEVAAFFKADFILLENVPDLIKQDSSHGLFSALKAQAET